MTFLRHDNLLLWVKRTITTNCKLYKTQEMNLMLKCWSHLRHLALHYMLVFTVSVLWNSSRTKTGHFHQKNTMISAVHDPMDFNWASPTA